MTPQAAPFVPKPGVVYIPVPRCASCRFLDAFDPKLVAGGACLELGLPVSASFGCVKFEERGR